MIAPPTALFEATARGNHDILHAAVPVVHRSCVWAIIATIGASPKSIGSARQMNGPGDTSVFNYESCCDVVARSGPSLMERKALQVLAAGGRDRLQTRVQFHLAQLIEQRCPSWARQYPVKPRLTGRIHDSGEVRTREQGDVASLNLEVDFDIDTPEWG